MAGTASSHPSVADTHPALPEGAQVLERTFVGEPRWEAGIFHDRAETLASTAPEVGAHGGVVIRTHRVAEDGPSLDGTRASVGTFDRHAGVLVRVPSPAVNLLVRVSFASVDGRATRAWLVVDGQLIERVEVPAKGVAEASATVALTKRGLDITFVADLDVRPGTVAPDHAVTLAEGDCAVELVSLCAEAVPAGDGRRQVLVASDSLAQTYLGRVRPQTGWGECLWRHLTAGGCVIGHDGRFSYEPATRYVPAEGPVIVNAAMAGRSARSFMTEGRLAELLACVRPGDVILFQFGANDATRARPLRYASVEEFTALLDRYVSCACDRGATPVVVTPCPRHNFDVAGALTVDFAEYAAAERAYCDREGVALVDLSREAGELVATLGPERSRALYMKLSAGSYASYPDGIDDSTHLSRLGARTFGKLIARGVADAISDLRFIDTPEAVALVAPAHLEARVEAEGRAGVALRWDAVAGAEYYTVTVRAEGESAPALMTSLEPGFFDVAVPGRPVSVSYEVRAWHGNEGGPVATVAVEHEFAHAGQTQHGITGMNLYEVDEAGIADRINFSVRFKACPGVDTYRVVARNARAGQLTALGNIEAVDLDGLHCYGVSREPGWQVYVEGTGEAGRCVSEAVELPCRAVDAKTARSSWEVPF